MKFKDRTDAGIKLAEKLQKYKGKDVIVFALPRGGVVLGYEVAKKLTTPFDLVITKKIGHPQSREYAICAVSEKGEPVCNIAEVSKINKEWLEANIEIARREIKRRKKTYLGKMHQEKLEQKIAIIVDDGIATGLTMFAAINEIKQRKPKKIIVAIPVVPKDTAEKLKTMSDELVSLKIEEKFLGGVGSYYEEFRQVEDEKVLAIIDKLN